MRFPVMTKFLLLIATVCTITISFTSAFFTPVNYRAVNTVFQIFAQYRDSDRKKKDVARSRSEMGGGSIRQARISREVRDQLSDIICECDIKSVSYPPEYLLRSTSVAEVDISSDLLQAKVFVSVLGNSVEKRQVFVWLCENVGQVRYSLAKRLSHMKRVPEIFFKLADNKETSDLVAVIDEFAIGRVIISEGEDKIVEFEETDNDNASG